MYGGASEEGLNDQSIYFLRNYLSSCEDTKSALFMKWCRETAKMGVPPGRPEERPYLLAQQAFHE
jgi:hypothetical protein